MLLYNIPHTVRFKRVARREHDLAGLCFAEQPPGDADDAPGVPRRYSGCADFDSAVSSLSAFFILEFRLPGLYKTDHLAE